METKANARRIVACVNTCEGISTDLLENDPTSCATWIDDIAKLVQQRDELAAALRKLADISEECAGSDAALDAARAVLSRLSEDSGKGEG